LNIGLGRLNLASHSKFSGLFFVLTKLEPIGLTLFRFFVLTYLIIKIHRTIIYIKYKIKILKANWQNLKDMQNLSISFIFFPSFISFFLSFYLYKWPNHCHHGFTSYLSLPFSSKSSNIRWSMAEVMLPRKMEILNHSSKFGSPDPLHVLAVDDSHVDRKFIERLLRVSSCKGNYYSYFEKSVSEFGQVIWVKSSVLVVQLLLLIVQQELSNTLVWMLRKNQSVLRYKTISKRKQNFAVALKQYVKSWFVLQDLKVNLIMTDYSMPGMTGYELLKKIKVSKQTYNDIISQWNLSFMFI